MKPLISVIIPVHNRTFELRRALQSLVDQTRKDFEVIVCDNGSNEDVHSVVEAFKETLHPIYRRIENSGGPARPRNVAISLAQAEWISFLNSDDWWDEDRIAVVSAMLTDDVDVLYHPLRYIAKTGRPTRRALSNVVGFPMGEEPLRHMALLGNPIPTSATVVRRKLFNDIGGMCEEPGTFRGF